jgi:NitT/TauT family transport system ATP-binding protein
MRCSHLSFAYPEGVEVFRDFSVDLPDNTVTAVLGPSGCGKSTLLHLLAGILVPASGSAGGGDEGAVSYLFQEPRLLPWLTVRQNVEIVNREPGITDKYLEIVGLGKAASLFPSALSGGMRQRVAMARAFAFDAKLLLMDEPFQALDLALRISLVEAFRKLWEEDPRTAIFVTHDVQEALFLGDSILVLHGTPAEVAGKFDNPVPGHERRLDNRELLSLEAELYRLLITPGRR